MLEFKVDGINQQFILLRTYRETHRLPAEFHINAFEAKTYTGLGSIDSASNELATLRHNVLNRLVAHTQPQNWLNHNPSLQTIFHDELLAINAKIGLHDSEVDFAMAGFGDVCHQWIYALVYAQASKKPPPPFATVYQQWLMDSLRVASTVHDYTHENIPWQVQVISHAYGRFGLQIQRGTETDYVLDTRLACPAENFMDALLMSVAEHIQTCCGL